MAIESGAKPVPGYTLTHLLGAGAFRDRKSVV